MELRLSFFSASLIYHALKNLSIACKVSSAPPQFAPRRPKISRSHTPKQRWNRSCGVQSVIRPASCLRCRAWQASNQRNLRGHSAQSIDVAAHWHCTTQNYCTRPLPNIYNSFPNNCRQFLTTHYELNSWVFQNDKALRSGLDDERHWFNRLNRHAFKPQTITFLAVDKFFSTD